MFLIGFFTQKIHRLTIGKMYDRYAKFFDIRKVTVAENVRHDRLSYRVQPNPRFELKAGDSDVSEPIEIKS